MENENTSRFDEFETSYFSRRTLLPTWIKVFCWIFMFLGATGILMIPTGLMGYSYDISIYGIESYGILTLSGLIGSVIMIFKGFTAYSLWFEKDNAILLGKIDAIAGIVICIAMMVLSPILEDGNFSLRFELLFLIPYYQKMNKIEYFWHNKQYR
jgi:hypothetical protein